MEAIRDLLLEKQFIKLSELIDVNKSAFINLLNQSWDKVDFTKSEPERIKQFLTDPQCGPRWLNTKMNQVFKSKSFEVQFKSIYIHQRPSR